MTKMLKRLQILELYLEKYFHLQLVYSLFFPYFDLHLFQNTYLEEVYNSLSDNYRLGRARFMRMDKSNRALSYHYDEGIRLHIQIITNPHSWFILQNQTLYHMAEVGRLYILDANQYHSALNLSRENLPRVHIVISAEKFN